MIEVGDRVQPNKPITEFRLQGYGSDVVVLSEGLIGTVVKPMHSGSAVFVEFISGIYSLDPKDLKVI